jgi:hypothetical protein
MFPRYLDGGSGLAAKRDGGLKGLGLRSGSISLALLSSSCISVCKVKDFVDSSSDTNKK